MYTSFYNLAEIPFTISSDPRFLWCGKKHREALAKLRSALIEAEGCVVLTGDIGTGKTTLVNTLLQSLDSNVLVAGICHPTLGSLDFFNLIAHAYGYTADIASQTQFLLFIKTLLQQSRRKGKSVLLVIDEAHFLPEELFEEIRLLSDLEEEGNRLLTILLVGQQELKEILQRPRQHALRRRIKVFHEIEPLSEQETLDYVAHRLKVAGAGEPVFSSAALRRIHSFCLGYPRLINILCDRAMLVGYVNNQRQIDTAIIAECIEEMQLLNPLPPSARTQRGTEISEGPPALSPAGNGPGPEVVREDVPRLPHHDRKTAESGLRASTLHMHRNLFRSPLSGLTLLVLVAVAATIGRQLLTGHFSRPEVQLQQGQALEQAENVPEEPPSPRIRQKRVAKPKAEDVVDQQAIGAPRAAKPIDQPTSTLSPEIPLKKTVRPTIAEQGNPESATTAADRGNSQAARVILEADGGDRRDALQQQQTLNASALIDLAEQLAAASPQQALALLQSAVELEPDNRRAHFRLGKMYTEIKAYTLAIAAYQQALALDPDYSDALYNLGFVYALVGMYEQAEQPFSRVVRLEPGYLDKALFNLAVVQEKLGKKAESLANVEKAAALSPEDQKIRKFLQRLQAAMQESPR